ESILRIVPVIFGILLVVSPLLLANGLGKTTALIAAAITAISPAFVFYSRYYIPEMLLVFFTFAVVICGYRYVCSRNWVWALLTGVFAGLCCVTKETWVIAFGSMVFALVIMMLARRQIWKIQFSHLLLAILSVFVIWVLFYSSFFTNPAGLIDSIRGFKTYFGFAVNNQTHFHPWYYYLKLLIYNKASMGPPWTEAAVVILAGIGIALIVTRKGIGDSDSHLFSAPV
ncbi:MAG: glycosyltransferase family 39 protein, partial [Sedimentisphaerales bacterium]